MEKSGIRFRFFLFLFKCFSNLMWNSIIGNKKGVMRMCDEKTLKAQEQIREILEKYQYNPENLISILQEVQGRFGYLSRCGLDED